jgi:hypothetical protein
MKQNRRFPWLVFVGATITVSVVLGVDFGIPRTIIIVIALIGGLIFGSMALWKYANAHATGDEWWQDDSCSGWRGY